MVAGDGKDEFMGNFLDVKDEALLERVKLHDSQDAFYQIYERYNKLLYVVACRYLKDMEAAEDAVQQTFTQLWFKRADIEVNTSLKYFLVAMVKNHILNIIRRDKVVIIKNYQVAQQIPSKDNMIEQIEQRERVEIARAMIERFGEPKREICLLKLEGKLNNEEIAEKLSLTVDSVKSHYYQALKILRAKTKKK